MYAMCVGLVFKVFEDFFKKISIYLILCKFWSTELNDENLMNYRNFVADVDWKGLRVFRWRVEVRGDKSCSAHC